MGMSYVLTCLVFFRSPLIIVYLVCPSICLFKKQFVLLLCYYIVKERICEFVFQDGVRFYIYFDSDYELDADSVEEKNKVGTNFNFKDLTLHPNNCI